jgi:hypothetical protein
LEIKSGKIDKGIIENRNAIQMMKEISERLRIQIISVSDERASLEEIGKGADRIFEIKIENDVSNLSTKS